MSLIMKLATEIDNLAAELESVDMNDEEKQIEIRKQIHEKAKRLRLIVDMEVSR